MSPDQQIIESNLEKLPDVSLNLLFREKSEFFEIGFSYFVHIGDIPSLFLGREFRDPARRFELNIPVPYLA